MSTEVTSLDGFHGLNPADGLFLRAEHLRAIQSYARSLAFAGATAAGTGVVHGLGTGLDSTVSPARLTVSPGLAISPTGRLLQLGGTASLPLDAEHVPPRLAHGFWLVTLHWATGTSGSAPVYGSLCDSPRDGCGDPCEGGGRTIAPWLDEGVRIELTPDALPGLDAVEPRRRRNWLASAYFERERASGPPWLVPAGIGDRVGALDSRDWDDDTALPPEQGVPVGVLGASDDGWWLDQWTARRLVGGPVSSAAWQERLAMRPWPVFLAQVLQLEAELADLAVGLGGQGSSGWGKAGEVVVIQAEQTALRDAVERLKRDLAGTPVERWHQFKQFEADTDPAVVGKGGFQTVRSLAGLGIDELPPGGYLATDETAKSVREVVTAAFGEGVDLAFRELRADQVAGEILAAQHRDRIPLHSDIGRPQVDVLLPVVPADRPEQRATGYGWVGFVHRPATSAPDPVPAPDPERTEDVTVYFAFAEGERPEDRFADGSVAKARELGVLTYPEGGWDFPAGDLAHKAMRLIADVGDLVGMVALGAAEERLPLAALRASLFGASLDSGDPRPVHAYRSADGAEAIVLLLHTRNA